MKEFTSYISEAAELTLQYHDTLNPRLWRGTELKTIVKKKLLEIGKAWAEFANIDTDAIEDIVLVGGNANYNYTSHSDIDVHIIVDSKKIPDCPEVIEDYFKDKKQLWALTHKIKVYGHDVELYAQDKNMKFPKDQGVFSLEKNKWIVKPKHHEVDMDNPHIVKKVNEYKSKIENLIASNSSDESFQHLKDKFKNMRASAIQKAGEFAFENLVFKELRNIGILDRMNEYLRSRQDEKLSL